MKIKNAYHQAWATQLYSRSGTAPWPLWRMAEAACSRYRAGMRPYGCAVHTPTCSIIYITCGTGAKEELSTWGITPTWHTRVGIRLPPPPFHRPTPKGRHFEWWPTYYCRTSCTQNHSSSTQRPQQVYTKHSAQLPKLDTYIHTSGTGIRK